MMQAGDPITFEIQSPYLHRQIAGRVLRIERPGFATVDSEQGVFGSVFEDVDGKFYTGVDAHQRRMRRERAS